MKTWMLAARPKTLSAAFVPVMVGTALVASSGFSVKWWVSIVACLSAAAIQVGTNFLNDVLDAVKGTDTAKRLGPTRVTQQGLLSPRAVFLASIISFLIALLLGVPLVLEGGVPILLVGIFSLLFGYAYTGGPYPISYLGVGEFFVILFFGIVAVGGVFFLHTGIVDFRVVIAGLQVGMLATLMLAINNLRDVEGDRRAKKRTFAVRFGVNAAKGEIAFFLLTPFLLSLFWLSEGMQNAALLPFLTLPIAVSLLKGVFSTPPSRFYNRFLARASLLSLLFGLLLSIGLVVG